MSTIKKFKIVSKYPEDETFELTKIMVQKTIYTTITEVDESGNYISLRGNALTTDSKIEVNEGMSAIGKQSGQPAQVIILETDTGLTEDGKKEMQDRDNRKPIINLKGF